MDLDPIKEVFGGVTIATVINWLLAFIACGAFGSYVYKKIEVRVRKQDEEAEIKKRLEEHDTKLDNISMMLKALQENAEKRDRTKQKELRHAIINAGQQALYHGSITTRSLKSLEELYEEYEHEYDGNSYASTLMLKVRQLPVTHRLDSEYNDID